MKAFLPLGILLWSVPAFAPAQVIINKAALVQLAGLDVPAMIPAPPPPAVPVPHMGHHHHARPVITAVLVKPPVMQPVPVVAKPVEPAIAKPIAPPAPPPPPGALAISFADGSAALPADAAAKLHGFCGWHGMITVNAHAANDPNDPSGAMRLSMERAFAVKAALTGCGVAGSNILPLALGAASGGQITTVGVEGPKP